MTIRTFAAIIHKEGDVYIADCPEVGTVSQGHTLEEAIAHLKEATQLYLEELPLPDVSHVGRPFLTTFDVRMNFNEQDQESRAEKS